MTLTLASCLFDYNARYGILPRRGGLPTLTRSSGGVIEDDGGRLLTAPINTPRFGTNTIDGTPRQTLLLERAGTNLVPFEGDFGNAAWTKSNVISNPSRPDPFGASGSNLLNASSTSGFIYGVIGFTGNGTKSCALDLKAGSAAATHFGIEDSTSSASRGRVLVTWTNGVPAVTALDGSVIVYDVQSLANGFYRVRLGCPSVVATHANIFVIYPASSSSGTVYAFAPQAEDAPVPSSYIPTVGAFATRSAELLAFADAPTPQPIVIYAKFVERGSNVIGSNPRLWTLGAGNETAPVLLAYQSTAGSPYSLYMADALSGSAAVSFPSGVPVPGDVVEHVYIVNGSCNITIIQSINGGSAVSATASSGLTMPTAWSAPSLFLNGGSGVQGLVRFAEWRAAKLGDLVSSAAQDIMDEMRRFELNQNGALLPAGV